MMLIGVQGGPVKKLENGKLVIFIGISSLERQPPILSLITILSRTFKI